MANEANDSKLQSSDSQENSRDNAHSDCSKMVGFASRRNSPDAAVEKRYSTV